jgi:hypothetical protein
MVSCPFGHVLECDLGAEFLLLFSTKICSDRLGLFSMYNKSNGDLKLACGEKVLNRA